MERSFAVQEVSHEDAELMDEIGRLRYEVWQQEQSINPELFPDRCWIDSLDPVGRHWVVLDGDRVVAAARLTMHTNIDDDYRDMKLWKKCGKQLPLPTTDLGRLVVHKDYRGHGFAKQLNEIRVNAAREMGAKSVMVTASGGNKHLLCKYLGFEDIGETIYFEDRPNTLFYALQLNLD
jgi:predicted GNAT family N-acyltransferase